MANAELGRFALLVAALMLLVVLTAVDAELGTNGLLVRIGVTLELAAGVYAASAHRPLLILGLALALPALLGNWVGQAATVGEAEVVRHAATVLFLSYVGVLVLTAIHAEREVSLDTVLGGVAVYLIIGITYISIYELVMIVTPEAFTYDGRPLEDLIGDPTSIHGLSALMYYSFVTLTTLGYGDITPVRPISQMLATSEAIVGQLFVAIFIARLVALYTRSGAGGGDASGPPPPAV